MEKYTCLCLPARSSQDCGAAVQSSAANALHTVHVQGTASRNNRGKSNDGIPIKRARVTPGHHNYNR